MAGTGPSPTVNRWSIDGVPGLAWNKEAWPGRALHAIRNRFRGIVKSQSVARVATIFVSSPSRVASRRKAASFCLRLGRRNWRGAVHVPQVRLVRGRAPMLGAVGIQPYVGASTADLTGRVHDRPVKVRCAAPEAKEGGWCVFGHVILRSVGGLGDPRAPRSITVGHSRTY